MAVDGGGTDGGDGDDGDGDGSGGAAAAQHARGQFMCAQGARAGYQHAEGREGGKGNAPAMRAVSRPAQDGEDAESNRESAEPMGIQPPPF